MIVIYPDTNALHSDLLMQRKLSGELLDLLDDDEVEMCLSPVVVAETDRKVREKVDTAQAGIRAATRKAEAELGLETGSMSNERDALLSRFEAWRDISLAPLLKHSGCRIVEWSRVTAQDLVQRELHRRKPVLEKDGQSIGLRDTVIWHGLLELLEARDVDEDFVIFVSADKAFFEEKAQGLHDELNEEIEEIDGAWLGATRLRVFNSLARAVLEAQKLANAIEARTGVLSGALISFIESLAGEEWDYFIGGSRIMTSDGSFPFGMEDATLISVAGIEIDEIGEGSVAECSGYADFTFHGRMTSADAVDASYSDVEIVGGDTADFEVEVEFAVRCEIIAEIRFDLESSSTEVLTASVVW